MRKRDHTPGGRATDKNPYPCLSAEVIDGLASQRSPDFLPAESDPLPGPLTRREKVLFHLFTFIIGSWNLVLVDLAHTADRFFCGPWIAAWACILVAHLAVVLGLSRRWRMCTSRVRDVDR